MKILFLTALLSTLSFSALAKNMQCEVSPLIVSTGGYVIYGEKVVLETNVGTNKCTKLKLDNNDVSFCAEESEIQGGYNAYLVLNKSSENNSQISSILFGTSRRSKELIPLITNYDVQPEILLKLVEADIKAPASWDGGDSLLLDDAVNLGLKKGVLKGNEVLLYRMNNCNLN